MKKALFLIFLFALSRPVMANEWPKVREFEITVGFNSSSQRFDLNIPIFNEQGIPIYWFICKGGSDAYLDSLYDSTDVNYVGPFSCRLDIENRESGISLLGEDDSAVWYSRGQFHSSDFVGACADYPEYGRLRHFRLRGFELTLEVTGLWMKNDKIDYLLLKVSLKNDETATSSRAKQPGYLNPANQGRSCEKIEKGNDPLMCRNSKNYSWEECPK